MLPHSVNRGAPGRGALSWLGALLLAGSPAAQAAGGSETGVAVTSATLGVAGSSISLPSENTWRGSGAQSLAGAEASSVNFTLRSGVVWTEPAIPGDAPILFGARPATGDRSGGDTVDLFGFNFTAPGAGMADVELEGGFGVGTATLGNTHVATTVPAGQDAFGNPLPNSFVSVTNGNGSDSVADAFHYTPALMLASPHALLGESLKLRFVAEAGQPFVVVFGQTIDGAAFPVAPYAGQLAVVLNINFLGPLDVLPASGQSTLTLSVPDDVSLSGATVHLQMLAFDDLTLSGGAFSNELAVQIL